MDADVRDLIVHLHQAPYRCVLAVTGGGAAAVGWLLSAPGGSRTVLEAAVPYAEESLCEFLGRQPDSFCSAPTSRAMAIHAQQRARWLAPGSPTAGAGCTASLRSDRPKRGDHRFHVAVHTGLRTLTRSLTLVKEARDREGEEQVLDRVLLNTLAEALGLPDRVHEPLLPGEEVVAETTTESEALSRFFAGEILALCVETDGRMRPDAVKPSLLLPGAFNPLHAGHLGLAKVASEIVGAPAAFDLSVLNADKPPLADEEVRRRLTQFAWRAPAWLTRAATYVEKAELFPGCTFAVGADTAARVVQPRFYHDSEERMAEALGRIRASGCRFLTVGRVGADGHFLEADDLNVPEPYRDLFRGVPASAFRVDLSSTQLRAEMGQSR